MAVPNNALQQHIQACRNLPDASFQRIHQVKLLIADLTFQPYPRTADYLTRLLPQLLTLRKRVYHSRNMEDQVIKQYVAPDQRVIEDYIVNRIHPRNSIVVTWTPSRPPVSHMPSQAPVFQVL